MQLAELYQIFQTHPHVCTDTRQIKPNCIFFALTGESFNGNSFAATALAQGAEYVVIDQEEFHRHEPGYILVDNALKTLQDLAAYHRKQLTIPVIGITGTNGKTTSKELLYSVLSQAFKTSCTQGNLNNHIGVPLTVLSIDKNTEIAIVEMGANHVHEIASLCAIAQPTHGLITNVGKAHLEGFGSFEGVMTAKGELYDYLKAHQGQVFIQGDNPHLISMADQRKIKQPTTYGFSASNSVSGSLLQANPFLSFCWKQTDQQMQYEVQTQLTGTYNLENILAAVAVGLHFHLLPDQINTGIINYTPKNNRSQITKTATNTVIADFYNANSSSMQAALENLKLIQGTKKAAILGDMFELGDQSEVEHKKIIELASALGLQRLIFVGKAFFAQQDKRAEFYESTAELIVALNQYPLTDAIILLKASRGMAFEQVLKVL